MYQYQCNGEGIALIEKALQRDEKAAAWGGIWSGSVLVRREAPATLNTLDLIGQNDRERTLFEPPRPAQQEP